MAGGTVIAEYLEIAFLWHLLKKAPNHTTAWFPHTQQVCPHMSLRCEPNMSKHPLACSHLTSATIMMVIKGNHSTDCCLQKQQTVFTDLCPSHSLHQLQLSPHWWFLPPSTVQLANRCRSLSHQEGRTIFIFIAQINYWLCLLISH